jgi:putative endonuclease
MDGLCNPATLEFAAMRERQPVVCILASEQNGTLYIGVTSDLIQRAWQHRSDLVEGFSNRYRAHCLVYFEQHGSMEGHPSRKADQEVESRVEAGVDRKAQSVLARFVSRIPRLKKGTGFPLSRE